MRNWKIGSITAGIFLIAIGLLWFLQSFLPIPYMKILLNSWPIACILLGIEILAFHLIRKEDSLRFHGFGIFLLIIVMITSFVFNFGHLLIKELGISMNSTRIEISDEKTIPSTVQEVVIDAQDGEVNVTGTDAATIKINGSILIPKDKNEDFKKELSDYYSIKTIGKTIYVECKQDNLQLVHLNESRSKLNIELPQSMLTKIKVNDGSIDIRNKSNKTEVELDNGDLTIEKLSGILIAKSQNGSITMNDVNLSNKSKITTDDGNIDIENIKGLLNIKVNNGSVSVNYADLMDSSEIKTDDGDITIKNLTGSVNTITSQGMTSIRHADIKGKSKLIADDGDIQIEDFKGELQSRTKNGSITIDEAFFTNDSKITTEDGNIQIDLLKKQDLSITAEKEDGSIDGNIGFKNDEENQKQAVLGLGTTQLKLKTMNGSISVNN